MKIYSIPSSSTELLRTSLDALGFLQTSAATLWNPKELSAIQRAHHTGVIRGTTQGWGQGQGLARGTVPGPRLCSL